MSGLSNFWIQIFKMIILISQGQKLTIVTVILPKYRWKFKRWIGYVIFLQFVEHCHNLKHWNIINFYTHGNCILAISSVQLHLKNNQGEYIAAAMLRPCCLQGNNRENMDVSGEWHLKKVLKVYVWSKFTVLKKESKSKNWWPNLNSSFCFHVIPTLYSFMFSRTLLACAKKWKNRLFLHYILHCIHNFFFSVILSCFQLYLSYCLNHKFCRVLIFFIFKTNEDSSTIYLVLENHDNVKIV